MPSFDRPTGRTDTVTLTFNYSGAAKSGGPIGFGQVDYQFAALPGILVSCMDGYLLSVGTGAVDNGDGTYTFKVAENGIVVYTTTVAYATQVTFSRTVTLTLHTEEWLSFTDDVLQAEFYERLSADITGVPSGAYAKKGARLKQIYGTSQNGIKVPSFLVQCATGISASNVAALHGTGTASIDWTCSRTLPVSIPTKTVTYVPGGGGASVDHSTSKTSCSSSGGGDTFVTDLGSAQVAWCPMASIQINGDLMEYDIPWSGGAVNYELFDGRVPDDTGGFPLRYEVNKYSIQGYPGVGDYPPAPGSVYAAAGSSANRSFNHEFFDVITGPVRVPGFHYTRSTFVPMRGGAGAPFALFSIGAPYDVWKVDHVSGRTVEDCSDVTKWSSSGPPHYSTVTLTQVGGAIRAVTGAQAGLINLHFGSTPLKVYAWRYMDALIRSVGSANVVLKFLMAGEPLSTGLDEQGAHALRFDIQTGADGAWVTRRIDMIAPSIIYWNSEFPFGAQKPYKHINDGKQNFDPLPNGLGMGNDMLGPIQFSDINGDNILGIQIPPNTTIEIDNLGMVTADAASVYQTLAPAMDDPNIWAWTDKRLSMMRKVSFMPDLYYVRDQLILQEVNLWTVTAPGGGYPTSDPILSLDGCAKWLGGGNGWVWDGTNWSSWIEKNDTGAGLTWQAQPCAFQVTIYPGMNSPVGAASGTLSLRFRTRGSSRVYGHVFELGAPVNNAEVRVYHSGYSTFASPNKTVNTDADGFYKVAMKPDIYPGGTGYFYYITNFLLPYSQHYSRSELAASPGAERSPPEIVYIEGWQPYGADLSPIHASFWLGVATPCGTMPWNLTDKYGNLHDVCVKNGNAIYFRSDAAVPPFAIANIEVTDTGDVMDPRMVRDYRDRLLMVFTRTR